MKALAHRRSILLFLLSVPVVAVVAGACSGGNGGGSGEPLDVRAIDFSLEHIVQRRVHVDMWTPTVLAALRTPTRPLSATPPPPAPCVTVVAVAGDVNDGFMLQVVLTDCEDLTGVTRVTSGVIAFTGDKFENGDYTGTYRGSIHVEWKPDPDGGRRAEAAKLNAEAATLQITGSWRLDVGLSGFVTGTAAYSAGSVTHTDEFE